jgi:hypothetical protein
LTPFVVGSSLIMSHIEFTGIFVGENKVVHFTPDRDSNSNIWVCSDSSFYNSSLICSSYPKCGSGKPKRGVVRSCLDCFLRNGSLYRFKYGVSRSVFFAHVRGGTCSLAKSDPPEEVIRRALYLLKSGFGNYHVFQNNCEDFALYCKTGLRVVNTDTGTSGQAISVFSVVGASLPGIIFSFLKRQNPICAVTLSAGTYSMNRYANDIGVRDDVIRVRVEDLAVNLGWAGPREEVADDSEASEQDFVDSAGMFFLFVYYENHDN